MTGEARLLVEHLRWAASTATQLGVNFDEFASRQHDDASRQQCFDDIACRQHLADGEGGQGLVRHGEGLGELQEEAEGLVAAIEVCQTPCNPDLQACGGDSQ